MKLTCCTYQFQWKNIPKGCILYPPQQLEVPLQVPLSPKHASSLLMQHIWKEGTNRNFMCMTFPSRFGNWAVLGCLNMEQPLCTPSSLSMHRELQAMLPRWSAGDKGWLGTEEYKFERAQLDISQRLQG